MWLRASCAEEPSAPFRPSTHDCSSPRRRSTKMTLTTTDARTVEEKGSKATPRKREMSCRRRPFGGCVSAVCAVAAPLRRLRAFSFSRRFPVSCAWATRCAGTVPFDRSHVPSPHLAEAMRTCGTRSACASGMTLPGAVANLARREVLHRPRSLSDAPIAVALAHHARPQPPCHPMRENVARPRHQHEARAIGDHRIGRPLGPRLQPAAEAVGSLGKGLLAGPRSHSLSQRLAFAPSELRPLAA